MWVPVSGHLKAATVWVAEMVLVMVVGVVEVGGRGRTSLHLLQAHSLLGGVEVLLLLLLLWIPQVVV